MLLFNQECGAVWLDEVHKPDLSREFLPQPGTIAYSTVGSSSPGNLRIASCGAGAYFCSRVYFSKRLK